MTDTELLARIRPKYHPLQIAGLSGHPGGSNSPSLRPGQRVRVLENITPNRYRNRLGTISRIVDGEVGVVFTSSSAAIWFRPSEIITY